MMTIKDTVPTVKDAQIPSQTTNGDVKSATAPNSRHQLRKNSMNGSVITFLEYFTSLYVNSRKEKFVPGEDLNE